MLPRRKPASSPTKGLQFPRCKPAVSYPHVGAAASFGLLLCLRPAFMSQTCMGYLTGSFAPYLPVSAIGLDASTLEACIFPPRWGCNKCSLFSTLELNFLPPWKFEFPHDGVIYIYISYHSLISTNEVLISTLGVVSHN